MDGPRNDPSQDTANLGMRTCRSGMRCRRHGLREPAADRSHRRTGLDLARTGTARGNGAADVAASSICTCPDPNCSDRYGTGPVLAAANRDQPAARHDVSNHAPAAGHHHTTSARCAAAWQLAGCARISRRGPATDAAARNHRAEFAAARWPAIDFAANDGDPITAPAHRRRAICVPSADDRPGRSPTGADHARHASIGSRAAPRLDRSL